MRKEIIRKGYYVQITFNKKNITQITSNVFWTIPVNIENKNNLPNKEFEKRAYKEMEKKYVARKERGEKWIKTRREIYKKYWKKPRGGLTNK